MFISRSLAGCPQLNAQKLDLSMQWAVPVCGIFIVLIEEVYGFDTVMYWEWVDYIFKWELWLYPDIYECWRIAVSVRLEFFYTRVRDNFQPVELREYFCYNLKCLQYISQYSRGKLYPSCFSALCLCTHSKYWLQVPTLHCAWKAMYLSSICKTPTLSGQLLNWICLNSIFVAQKKILAALGYTWD